ncbi:2,3-diketo-L-gulonate-binding periplasmic protein YiaO [subsurface metagenome]
MLRRLIIVSLTVSLLCLSLMAFTAFANENEPIVLKVGDNSSEDSPYAMGIKKLIELVNERSPQKFDLQLFPFGQLGSTRERIEGVQTGTQKMTVGSTGALSGFIPNIAVFDFPYLFRDDEHVQKVLDGPVGQDIVEGSPEDLNLRVLCYFENGWRHVTNNSRVIEKPEDLKGLKIRVMESKVFLASLNAMGASATAMPWPEVISSLRVGIIDGQENVPINILNDHTYEVQKYLSLTKHFYNPAVVLINEKFFQSLSKDVQEIIKESAKEAAVYQRNLAFNESEKAIEILEEKGMIINRNPDIDAFVQATKSVYDKFPEMKPLIEKIQAVK